jgi:uncharacterized protein YigA (DUF484 family)
MNEPDILKINDENACKFQKIKTDLTTRRSAVELFETLFTEIETEFGVPFAWLSLIRLPETAGLLESLEASVLLRERINSIEQALFLEIISNAASPLLVSGDLRPFFRLLPHNRKYFIRSLAVSPITLHGRLIGSMNHGDASPTRYEPGMDTTLLMHLARSVSDRLTQILPPHGWTGQEPSFLT